MRASNRTVFVLLVVVVLVIVVVVVASSDSARSCSGFLWTRDAFTGLLKERSFVRSFVATSGFRGLFCSRLH
jgi:hypothetical protein